MSSALAFQDTTFDVVDRDGQPWVRSKELAAALGYSDDRKVSTLYSRHRDEFTDSMSVVLNLGTTLIPNETRIFSLRGCHLLAMFARTPVAKAFRVWVLDVLERLNGGSRPALESSALSTPDDRAPLRSLVHAWSMASGLHHAALWPQVKAYFQLSRIEDLPIGWIPDALAFAQSKIDECQRGKQKALPPAEPTPQCRMAAEHLASLRKLGFEFSEVSDRLFGLFVRDDVVQSLRLATVLSIHALVSHFSDLAARE